VFFVNVCALSRMLSVQCNVTYLKLQLSKFSVTEIGIVGVLFRVIIKNEFTNRCLMHCFKITDYSKPQGV